MANVIIPKTYVRDIYAPLIFLAGPIRGAPKWHLDAISTILTKDPGIAIAAPIRDDYDKIHGGIMTGDGGNFPRQRVWENHYLTIASQTGCIMFWLPGEVDHSCEKSYGAMTRLELGEWMAHFRHDPSVRLCVGTDGNFSEIDTIKVDFADYCPGKQMHPTLEKTCEEAIRLARQTPKDIGIRL